jgi:hypothetical protein
MRGRFLLCTLLFILGAPACSRRDSADSSQARVEANAKLIQLRPELLRLARNDQERKSSEQAEPFVNIKGLDMQVAGYSVPFGTNGNRVHVSFTIEHLKNTPIEKLAGEAMDNFRLAAGATELIKSSQ